MAARAAEGRIERREAQRLGTARWAASRLAGMVRPIALVLLLAACPGAADPPWHVQPLPAPTGAGARFPHLAAGAAPVLSWLEPDGDGFALRHATWTGEGWGAAQTVARGDDWLINGADFPSVVQVSPTRWVAQWLVKHPGGIAHAYDVRLATSTNGIAWSQPAAPYDDATPAEHGFVSLMSAGGELHAVWLDGRHAGGHGHGGGATALRGATLDAAGRRVGPEFEIDPRVCDCCQTDVAATDDGPVVVYRDRGPDEVRDIALVRREGTSWSAPQPVHADGWVMPGCPVNGPAVDARGRVVAVAWFTAPDQPRVRLAFSDDAGRSFAAPIEVAQDEVVGRVDVAVLPDGGASVSLARRRPRRRRTARQAVPPRRRGRARGDDRPRERRPRRGLPADAAPRRSPADVRVDRHRRRGACAAHGPRVASLTGRRRRHDDTLGRRTSSTARKSGAASRSWRKSGRTRPYRRRERRHPTASPATPPPCAPTCCAATASASPVDLTSAKRDTLPR